MAKAPVETVVGQTQGLLEVHTLPPRGIDQGEQYVAELVDLLRVKNDEFQCARAGRTPEARADKRRLRKERRHTLSSIYVSLARVGEVDRVDALQAMPVQRQLEELEKYLRHP